LELSLRQAPRVEAGQVWVQGLTFAGRLVPARLAVRKGGRSSVWLEHSTVTREVAGSSPVAPVVGGLTVVPQVVGRMHARAGVSQVSVGSTGPLALVVKLVDTPS